MTNHCVTAKTSQGGRRASPGLTELIGRALTDEKFRKHLYTNRAHAQRFGEGSASARAVSVVVKGTF